jgi:hypothetical protein
MYLKISANYLYQRQVTHQDFLQPLYYLVLLTAGNLERGGVQESGENKIHRRSRMGVYLAQQKIPPVAEVGLLMFFFLAG